MILQGIRNFLKGLKYVFVPMGVLFFGLVLGLSVSLPRMAAILKDFAAQMQRIFGESTLSGSEMMQSLWMRVSELDWSNPLQAVRCRFWKRIFCTGGRYSPSAAW